MTLPEQTNKSAIRLQTDLNKLHKQLTATLSSLSDFYDSTLTLQAVSPSSLKESILTTQQKRDYMAAAKRYRTLGRLDKRSAELLGIMPPQPRQMHKGKKPKQDTIPAHITNLILALNKLDQSDDIQRSIVANMLKPIATFQRGLE